MALRGNGGTAAIRSSNRTAPFLIALWLAVPLLAAPVSLWAQTQPSTQPSSQPNAQPSDPSGQPISLLPGSNGSGETGPSSAGTPQPGTPQRAAPQPANGTPGNANPAVGNNGNAANANAGTGVGGKAVTTVNGIGIGTLTAPAPSEVGTLDTAAGALPPNFWQGSSLALVEALMPKLPVSTSPAMQSLARRLLLSPGAVPAGAAKGSSLIALRVRTLLSLGDVPEALALVKAATASADDMSFVRAAIDTYWLSGKTHAACGRVFQIARRSTGNGTLEDSAFCHLLAGQRANAGIDAGLLREQKGVNPAFFQLYARLSGLRNKPVSQFSDPTPLLLAMLSATKDPPPASIVTEAKPDVAYFVARMAHAPIALRLSAAEQAVAQGGLPAAMLRKLYASVSFTENDLANAPTTAKTLADARGNALMYQAVRRETEPLAEAEALQASFGLAKQLSGTALPVFRADKDALDALAPSRNLAWFAPDAVRALLALGQFKAASAWYALVTGGTNADQTVASGTTTDPNLTAGGSENEAQAAARLAPLLALAGTDAAPSPAQALAAWYAAAGSGADPAPRSAEAGLLFTLSEALGEKVPEQLWLPLYGDTALSMATTPPPALDHGLAQAAKGEEVGKALLFSLVSIGSGGPAVASAGTLANVITALDAVGLGSDAHRIAVEAALGGV